MVVFTSIFMPATAHAAFNFDRNAAINDTVWYDPKDYSSSENCTIGSGSGPLMGNDNAEKIFIYLTGKGLTAAQAAGILGNFQQESGFDPAIIEGGATAGPNYLPVNGVGFGLAQWTFSPRQDPLVAMARDTNRNIIDLSLQLDYLWSELTGTYINALNNLKKETTPERAAYVFHRDYEGSADSETTVILVRGGNARALYDKYQSLAPGTVISAPGPASKCTPSGGTGGLSDFMGDDFVIYNQCAYPPFGGPWGNRMTPYGQTMCSAACGPTSLAMVAINMTGAKVTPNDTIDYYTAHSYWYDKGGSLISAIGDAAPGFGMTATRFDRAQSGNLAAYQEVFAKGGLIITAAVGTSPYLSTGHAIVLRGITADGKFLIADPGYKETNIPPANQFSTNQILTTIRSDPNSGVFALYKK